MPADGRTDARTPPTEKYEGGAFSPDERTFGSLTVNDSELRYRSPTESLAFPIRDLNIEAGGANGKTLFFTHPDHPGRTLFTTDPRILKDSVLIGDPLLHSKIRRILRERNQSRIFLAGFLILLALSIASLFIFKEALVLAAVDRIPLRWEAKLGQAALNQLKANQEFIQDARIREDLLRIAEPVFEGIPDTGYEFRVHLAKDSEINAFALPGGIIVLNSGLILSANSPEQVAGVLAHEAAHVTLRHGMRQIVGSIGLFALVQALFGDATGLLSVLIDRSALLLTRKYSRDYEREADETGWNYLVASGIDPGGMISFFDLLLRETEGDPSDGAAAKIGDHLTFLSTHPATPERIERFRQKWRESDFRSEDFKALPLDFKAFQEHIRLVE